MLNLTFTLAWSTPKLYYYYLLILIPRPVSKLTILTLSRACGHTVCRLHVPALLDHVQAVAVRGRRAIGNRARRSALTHRSHQICPHLPYSISRFSWPDALVVASWSANHYSRCGCPSSRLSMLRLDAWIWEIQSQIIVGIKYIYGLLLFTLDFYFGRLCLVELLSIVNAQPIGNVWDRCFSYLYKEKLCLYVQHIWHLTDKWR